MLERDIENPVVKWVKDIGIKVRKLNGLGNRDDPDRLFWLPGWPFLIEFKKPGEVPTEKQALRIKELQDLGYDVEVHDNVEEAKQAVIKQLELRSSMGSPSVSEKSDKILVAARSRRAVSRPRLRKDQCMSRRSKGPKDRKTPW